MRTGMAEAVRTSCELAKYLPSRRKTPLSASAETRVVRHRRCNPIHSKPAASTTKPESPYVPIHFAACATHGNDNHTTPSGFHAKPVKRFARSHSPSIHNPENAKTNP